MPPGQGGSKKHKGNGPVTPTPNKIPKTPDTPSTLTPKKLDMFKDMTPAKDTCVSDDTTAEHRLRSDEDAINLSWAEPMYNDTLEHPNWSTWQLMVIEFLRFHTNPTDVRCINSLLQTCVAMMATFNAIWGRSLRRFMGWMADPDLQANMGFKFLELTVDIVDIQAIVKSTTPFATLHMVLETQTPEVLTKGAISGVQWAAHLILYLSMCVTRCAGITVKRKNDVNGYLELYTYDIYGAILWTCATLKRAIDIGTLSNYTIFELGVMIGELFRMDLTIATGDESDKPVWAQLPIIESPSSSVAHGIRVLDKIQGELGIKLDPDNDYSDADNMPWSDAPHNPNVSTESNFQFKNQTEKDVGEALIQLYFQASLRDWDKGCAGYPTSVVMAPFLVSADTTNSDAETYYKPTGPAYIDWWPFMKKAHEDMVQTILNDSYVTPPNTPPPSPKKCTNACLPFENEVDETCQALPVVYVPIDVSIPVTNQTPLDMMMKWDGKPAPTYLPILKRNASGAIIIDQATLKPILDAWVPVANPTVPALPASCSGPAPPKPGGNPCTVCVPFMDKDGTCKPTQPLYVPKDATVTVVDENTVMVPFTPKNDGTDPPKAYTPNVVKMPDGTMQIQGWVDVVPSLIKPPVLPETCTKPDPTPSGGGGGGGGEGALALILLLVLALLFFSRRR